jgi:DNA ligase-1
MEYAALVGTYDRLAGTQSTHEKVAIVAEALAETEPVDLPMLVQLLRGQVFAAWESGQLGVSSSLAKRAIARATGVRETTIEDEWRRTGDLGSAAARAVADRVQQTLVSETLTVEQVYDSLEELADYRGEGSEQRRVDTVAGLVADASPDEARYVVRTALGHLRLGVGEGAIRDAIAAAFLDHAGDDHAHEAGSTGSAPDRAAEAVERALQVTNDAGLVARTAATEGRAGLDGLDVEIYRPITVMLADKADSVDAAVVGARSDSAADSGADAGGSVDPGPVLVEHKLDGFRVQVHADGDGPRVFTRRLEEVTAQFPDVVAAVEAGIDATEYVVEGEVVGYDPETGDPVPFQQLSRRIKRKHDVHELVEEIPVALSVFDALVLDGETLLDDPLEERLARLTACLDERERVIERTPNLRTAAVDAVDSFYEGALAAGQEGVMVKNLDATYQPGRRVGYMLKVKPTMESLDLVVTRAVWSEGRRSNNLGRLYLGCYDRDSDEFREVGRLSTGFTDDQLAELTDRLEPHILEQDGRDVRLEPTEVLEVAYEEIQESPEYSSGYALRFPRFEGFRDDLGTEDADTLDRVESLFESQ